MERITKRQRDILEYLDDVYPFSVPRKDILHLFGESEDVFIFNDLPDIKLLDDMKLVTLSYEKRGEEHLIITPKGKEKLRENFMTRLIDAIYDNPLKTISIIVAIILGLITLLK